MRLLSTAERMALAGALLLVLLHLVPALGVWLEYRAAQALTEPWRLLTGHLVHINSAHLVINAAAWWVVARLYAEELAGAWQLTVLGISALTISAGLLLLHPTIAWYRGFSGVLHALFFAGALQWLLTTLRDPARTWRRLWLPALLVVGGGIKVIAEQPGGSATPFADWLGAGTVPQAHLLGAITGALLGALAALRAPRSAAAGVGAR